MKYKANQDFVNSQVGAVRKGDIIEGKKLDDLLEAGYVSEYKTKVVTRKPAKPKKKTTKKASKK